MTAGGQGKGWEGGVGEREMGLMSDCCSRWWAVLMGCHSHRDTMLQPHCGGGAASVQQLRGEEWEEVDGSVCLCVCGWVGVCSVLFCTNRASHVCKSKSKRRQSNTAGSSAICQILMSAEEARDK